MRSRVCLVVCALSLLVPSARAWAQVVPGWNTKQFSLERIDADRVRLTREVEIEGEPGGPNAGQKFFADELELNTRTGELTARGNVVFSTATERVSAESVVFNTHTKLGTFTNASGIAQLGSQGPRAPSMFGTLEPDIYFYGATIQKVGPDKYTIKKGWFTTCVQPTPRWEVVTGSATINLHDYAILRNAVIQVKDVPVFYLPVLYYPIQDDDRATGFLIPTYGASTYRGQSLSNAFFWAINRSQDATFFHDWFFSRGTGMGTEYRYLVAPTSQGNFRAYFLNEHESEINGTKQPARQSSQITGSLSQGLPGHLTARARVDYFSDLTVQQLYNNSFYAASQSTRTISAGLSGAWRGLSVTGNALRQENFYNATDSFVGGQMPGVTVAYSGQKFPRVPVYGALNVEAASLVNQQKTSKGVTDLGLNKFDFLPSLRAPLSSLPYLTVNATFAYRATYFSESLADDGRTQIEEPVTRTYADMRAEVIGPVFSRVFNPGNGYAERIKHVIEPNFSVQRRTEISEQSRVPTSAGGYDTVIGGATLVSYGLSNRVLARKAAGGDANASSPQEILSVTIKQTYYTDPLASRYDNSYSYGYQVRPPNAFSPISLVARSAPVEPLLVDFRLEYDPVTGATVRIPGFGLNGTLRMPQVDATAGWSRNAYTTGRSANYLQAGSNFRVAGGKITGMAAFNFDIAQSTLLNQRYIGSYNAQCCGIAFEYQAFNYPSTSAYPVKKDRRFNLSFTLAGIGSFSNFLGAFGIGTY